ncbi:MAG: hypothetical protein QOI31_444 [Solirubrobacterales bacterium]|jgi:hypothetical protein|nr:hypothetical protein [Solirubrobacterales bacterium]
MLKGRGGRGIVGGAVSLTALAVASIAFAAGDRTVETKDFTIPGNDFGIGVAKCKKGSQVTGGGFSITPLSATDIYTRVKIAAPLEREWSVGLESFQEDDRSATSYALCRKGSGIRPVLERQPVDGSVQSINEVVAKCPRGSSVVGGGGATKGGYNKTFILESRPEGSRSWYVKTFTAFDFAGKQAAYATCDPKNSNNYETVSETSTTPVPVARRGVVSEVRANAKCPQGSETTGGGYATANDPNRAVIVSRPKGERTWLGAVRTYYPEEGFTSYARCLLG